MKKFASCHRISRVVTSFIVVSTLMFGLAVSQRVVSPKHNVSLGAHKSLPIADGSESNGGKGGKGGAKRSSLA